MEAGLKLNPELADRFQPGRGFYRVAAARGSTALIKINDIHSALRELGRAIANTGGSRQVVVRSITG